MPKEFDTTADTNPENPMISVIIPMYNSEKYIETCLRSVMTQSVDDIEVILIDDASTDHGPEIAQRVLNEYPHTEQCRIVRNEHNSGVAFSRNRGVESAVGKYIFFMDADDILAPYCFETLLHKAEETGADLVGGEKICFIDDVPAGMHTNSISAITLHHDDVIRYFGRIRKNTRYTLYFMVWNKLIRRSFLNINSISFISQIRVHSDEPWCFKSFYLSNNIVLIENVTYFYRDTPSSIINSLKKTQPIDSYNILVRYYYDAAINPDIEKYEKNDLTVLFFMKRESLVRRLFDHGTFRQFCRFVKDNNSFRFVPWAIWKSNGTLAQKLYLSIQSLSFPWFLLLFVPIATLLKMKNDFKRNILKK